ncbi:MAG: hypothetical protein II712_02260, partial [Erysipelotrichaceae bacterium]|nr:hypothetical protein [Erysipelotrichaceae bacterium]
MKKIYKFLLVAALILAASAISFVRNERHIHAANPGDIVGYCPSCGHHTYQLLDILQQPTCTKSGLGFVMCSDCFSATSNYKLPALGHNFTIRVSEQAATCTEAGTRTLRCSRCSATTVRTISEPLGHDYVSSIEKEPTCTEEGIEKFTCSRCSDSYENVLAAFGHEYIYEEKDPTCIEKGYRKGICFRCQDETLEEYEPLGHDFPHEWTVEKPAGYLTKGLEFKLCIRCGEKLEQIIPAKIKPPVLITIITGTAAIAIYFFFKAKKTSVGTLKEKDLFKPSFETKSVVVESENEELLELLKRQTYLEVTGTTAEELFETAKEVGADLIICDITGKDRLDELLEKAKEDFPDSSLGLLINREFLELNRNTLNAMVSDHTILNYVLKDQGKYSILVKLVLPVLKPGLRSDESLENFGAIADLLGIPGVS